MEIYHAIILGIVEGITEYLPISSTGHLILTAALLGLNETEDLKRATDAFNIVIQGGAILAVLGLYRQRVGQMLRGLMGRDPAGRKLFVNLVIAFLPAAVLGVLLNETIEKWLFEPVPVMIALALGGIVMIVLRPRREDPVDIEDLTPRKALIIGFLQCIAMWPGTSRSMMTIIGGLLVGMRPKQAAEFSFLLGLPTLGGACVFTIFKNVTSDEPGMFEILDPLVIVVGLVVATIAAALAVKWLVTFLADHGLALFGWYRLGLCAVVAAFYLAGYNLFPEPQDAPPVPPEMIPVIVDNPDDPTP